MITAHSLRKAPPTVAEQLATKDVAPNNKKTVLIMLGIAAVLAYARSFFGEGPAFAGLPPAAPGSDAQQSATDTGFGTSDALRNAESDGAGDEASDEASGPSPVSDVLPVADSAFFFELLRSSGGFEIGAASSAALGLDDQLAALEPMAYRESNQSQSRFAFQPVSLPVSGSTASSDIPPVRVPLDTAGQDLSGPTGNTDRKSVV